MPSPRLSICIPTYNRSVYLDELFRSLEPQLTDEIEVVVSDNASTDNTIQVLERWKSRISNLRYRVFDHNYGADMNYLAVVDFAAGEYCWILGSDDTATEHSLSTILETLSSEPDCALFARMLCASDMAPFLRHSYWSFEGERVFDFASTQFSEYLKLCQSIAGVFSYLSAIVFRRSVWCSAATPMRLVGSAYVHVDILVRQISDGRVLLASPKIIVNCRCGNDSFSDGNKGKRLALDFHAYERVGNCLSDKTAQELMKVLTREHPLRNLIHVHRHLSSIGRGDRFQRRLRSLDVSQSHVNIVRFFSKNPFFWFFSVVVEPWLRKRTPIDRFLTSLRARLG
jgi:abequosyltransferase